MQKLLAGLSGGTGALAAGAAAIVLIGAGFWIQSTRSAPEGVQPVAAVAPTPEQTAPASGASEAAAVPKAEEPAPDAATIAAQAESQPEDAVTDPQTVETALPETPEETVAEASEAEPVLSAPEFDEVRREPDGVTVIAGVAAPGAEVAVMQNGVEIARTVADGVGKFAVIALIPPDGQGHVLTLLQTADGGELASDGEIILAPLSPPVDVAVAEATPADAPQSVPQEEEVATDSATSAPQAQEVATQTTDEPAAAQAAEQTASEPATTVVARETSAPTQAEVSADASAVSEEETTQQALSSSPIDAVTDVTAAGDLTSDTQAVADSIETAVAQADVIPAARGSDDAVAEEARAPTQLAAAEPSPAPVTPVLRSTEEGVELLNPARPEVLDNVAIDTISYSQVGEVQLAGRAQSRADSVRVYLNNSVIADLEVDAAGRWRGELPNVDEGIYTLRVDEVTAQGQVTSRVETPFKREPRETLAAASAAHDGPISEITVQKGATLWAIARDRYGDGLLYVRVFDANREAIRNPDLIYPGQVFDLPD